MPPIASPMVAEPVSRKSSHQKKAPAVARPEPVVADHDLAAVRDHNTHLLLTAWGSLRAARRKQEHELKD